MSPTRQWLVVVSYVLFFVCVCVPALGPFTLARQTLWTNKTKDQLFPQKRKYNDYNIRTGKKKKQQLNSYISLTNYLFLKKIPTIFCSLYIRYAQRNDGLIVTYYKKGFY